MANYWIYNYKIHFSNCNCNCNAASKQDWQTIRKPAAGNNNANSLRGAQVGRWNYMPMYTQGHIEPKCSCVLTYCPGPALLVPVPCHPGPSWPVFPCLFVCQVSVNFSHSARYPSVALQTTSIWAAAALVAAARRHYYNVPAQPTDSLQPHSTSSSPSTFHLANNGFEQLMDCQGRRHSEKWLTL